MENDCILLVVIGQISKNILCRTTEQKLIHIFYKLMTYQFNLINHNWLLFAYLYLKLENIDQ